ncbi:MAG: peptidylprolyl isomerase [Mangrovimonas sp.]|nr:peptidylprolyl isomerase [Mangrovimonas sp.]
MAVLNKIRQRSLVLIIVIAMALFAFVLSDLITKNNAFSSKSQNVVATVAGEEIGREDFLKKVQAAQRNNPNATSTQIMNSIYNQEVRKIVLGKQYEALGLSVERDQMRDVLKSALAQMPEFQNEDGIFDENKLNEFIANLKEISPNYGYLGGQPIDYASWKDYEDRVSVSSLQQDYFNLVKAAAYGTQFDGKFKNELATAKRDIRYVQVPFSSIPDSTVAVSKSEIADYVKKHADNYQVEESRNIKYVEFKNVASKADEQEIESKLASLINDKPVYNETTKTTDTVLGFKNTKDDAIFINSNSDVKFDDRFVFKTAVPDSIYALNVGEIYGPYKDGDVYKLTKLIEEKMLPDSVKARHILIPYLGAAGSGQEVAKTKEQAKVFADSLLGVLKNDKSKFAQFVTDYSSDQGSIEKGGQYDWYPYNQMVPEFRDFTFEGKVGDMGVVETVYGFHIIEIEGQKNVQRAVKVGTIVRKIVASEQTEKKIFRDASSFEFAVSNGDFDQVAKDSNYVVRPVNQIKALDENIPGAGNQRQIVQWAFKDDTSVGDIKRFDVSTGYIIAQVTAKNEKGLMSTDEASVPVSAILRKEKKATMIKNRISAKTIDDLASAENTSARSATGLTMESPTISGAGKEPYIVGAAFALNEGETSGLLVGERGVYMIEVTKAEPAVQLDNYQSFANQIEQQRANTVSTKLYSALEKAADIEDNRAKTVQ